MAQRWAVTVQSGPRWPALEDMVGRCRSPQTVSIGGVVASDGPHPGLEEPSTPSRQQKAKQDRQVVGEKGASPRSQWLQGQLKGLKSFPLPAAASHDPWLLGPLEYQPPASIWSQQWVIGTVKVTVRFSLSICHCPALAVPGPFSRGACEVGR